MFTSHCRKENIAVSVGTTLVSNILFVKSLLDKTTPNQLWRYHPLYAQISLLSVKILFCFYVCSFKCAKFSRKVERSSFNAHTERKSYFSCLNIKYTINLFCMEQLPTRNENSIYVMSKLIEVVIWINVNDIVTLFFISIRI